MLSLVRFLLRGGFVALVLIALAGCTGAGDVASDESAGDDAASEAISKEEFVAEANAICESATAELQAAEPDSTQR